MGKSFKHGDEVIAIVGRGRYEAHIEERFITKSPSKKRALFVVFDTVQRLPVEIENYLKFYGTLELKQSNTE